MDFSKIRNYLFLGLLLIVTIVFLSILRPFAYPIFWAAVIAALFYPLFNKLNGWLKHPNLSATITLVTAAAITLIPLAIITTLLIGETISLYSSVANTTSGLAGTVSKFTNFIKNNSYSKQFNIDEGFWIQKFADTSQLVLDYLFTVLKNITQNSLTFLVALIIMLYTLFFFIRDGEKIIKKLLYLCPLGDKYEIMLYRKFTSAASAIVKGTVILGGIQGLIGGIVFAIAGIKGALIWAIIMTLLSIVPGVGSSIVWLPAGIIMLLTGNIWQGIMILAVGLFVISTVDNLLRPLLVGRPLEMHPLIVLFSTLGGIALFGISGFMIGPIVAALFLAFWEMYEEYYRVELKKN